jgi:type II secretory pathway component GspD/PulD (secretin)
VQITRSATGEKLLFRGTAQYARRLEEVLRLIDVPEAAAGIDGSPQLEVYSLTQADPGAVKDALDNLLGDDPNVRISADDDNGFIVAIARPSQHATIRATIDQMQKEKRQVDVIQLSDVDPQTAVMAISKLFGGTGDEPDPKAPRVDADIATRSLMIRGTTDQVSQIRALLRKMGETEDAGSGLANSAIRARKSHSRRDALGDDPDVSSQRDGRWRAAGFGPRSVGQPVARSDGGFVEDLSKP